MHQRKGPALSRAKERAGPSTAPCRAVRLAHTAGSVSRAGVAPGSPAASGAVSWASPPAGVGMPAAPTPRSIPAASTAAAIRTSVPASDAYCMPCTKASRASVVRPWSVPATAPPRVCRAVAGAVAGMSAR